MRQFGSCRGPLDVDEIVSRGRGGSYLIDENCQTLCRRHHEMKHQRIHFASIIGLWGEVARRKHEAQEIGTDASLDDRFELSARALAEFNR